MEPEKAPSRVNLSDAEPVQPGRIAPVKDLPPHAQAGVQLARYVLMAAAVFLSLLLVVIVVSEQTSGGRLSQLYELVSTASSEGDSTAVNHILGLLEEARADREATRAFILEVLQMVLLNTILPVLTALLGYIFGSRQRG